MTFCWQTGFSGRLPLRWVFPLTESGQRLSGMFGGTGGSTVFGGVSGLISVPTSWGSHCPRCSNNSRKRNVGWAYRWESRDRQVGGKASYGFRAPTFVGEVSRTSSPSLCTSPGAVASASISRGPVIKSSANFKAQNVWKLDCFNGSSRDKGKALLGVTFIDMLSNMWKSFCSPR